MALNGTEYRLRSFYQVPFLGATFENVWYFVRILGEDGAEFLRTAFISDFVPIIESILPDFVTSTLNCVVESLTDPDDYATGSTPIEGTLVSTESAPSFLCASYQISRSTRQNKRHGRKAFGPIAEDFVNGNQPTAAYLVALDAASVGFNLNCNEGTSTYRIGIPRSLKVPNPNAPPDEIYVIQDVYPMEAMPFRNISSQNSRKRLG